MLRRYAPEFLSVLKLKAASAAKGILDAIDVLRSMNTDNVRKVAVDAPTEFVKQRWAKLVFTDDGIDRRFYELCVLSELKNALRSGDVWVQGSRQFKAFDEYLIPIERFANLKLNSELRLAVTTDCDKYLHDRLSLLEQQLTKVNRIASTNNLPDAILTESGLKITPLDAVVPDAAQALINQSAALLPRVKITELLMEVDEWTDFTRDFTHLKTGDTVKDKTLLLSTILADALNLGLTKMAESCPGMTYAKLSWLQACTSERKPIRLHSLSWSMLNSANPLLRTGEMEPHRHQMANDSNLAVRPRVQGMSIRNMVAILDGCFTPTSPTSMRPSTPR